MQILIVIYFVFWHRKSCLKTPKNDQRMNKRQKTVIFPSPLVSHSPMVNEKTINASKKQNMKLIRIRKCQKCPFVEKQGSNNMHTHFKNHHGGDYTEFSTSYVTDNEFGRLKNEWMKYK